MSEVTSASGGMASGNIRMQSTDRSRQASAEERMRSTSGGANVKEFVASVGITSAQAEILLKQYGRNELEDKQKPKVKNTVLYYTMILNLKYT